MITRRLALLLVVPLVAFFFVQFFHSRQAGVPLDLQTALTEQALASLKNEYDILIKGIAPPDGLVPRLVGMARLEFSAEERTAALLKSRESALQHGKHYASIEVSLNPVGLEEREGVVVLHAVGNVTEHFTFDFSPSPPVPDVYEESTHYDFIFSVTPVGADLSNKPYTVRMGGFQYTLTKDITEPQLLKVSDEEKDKPHEYARPPAVPLNESLPLVDNGKKRTKQ